MARRVKTISTTFEAGELDETLWHGGDEFTRAGCRRLRNWIIVKGGSVRRRPGSYFRKNVEADATRIDRIDMVEATGRVLVWSPTQLDVVKESDWTAEGSAVTSCPWAAGDIQGIQIAIFDRTVQAVSRSFWPRKLDRSSAGSWTLRSTSSSSGYPAYFDTAQDGQILAPFRRIAPAGIDLTPGALSGSTTFELGPGAQSWWVAGHAPNGLIRYHGQQVILTVVTDGDTATGGALGSRGLFPTHDLTVGSTVGFSVGEPLEGDTTGAQATVGSIIDATSLGVIYEGYPPSTSTSMFDLATPERIVGPFAATTASASANTTPAASVQWDEAMISDAMGYPGGCVRHKNRNILFDIDKSPSWIAASVVNVPFNFDLGEGSLTDAVVDGIGGDDGVRIRYAVSSEQLILLTSKGPYYVGESRDLPLAATTWNVNKIGAVPAGDCHPILVDEGVIMAESKHVHVILPTGNAARPWDTGELAEFCGPLIGEPTRLTFTEGLADEVSRYLYVRNDDGTIAIMRNQRGSTVAGWALWYTGDDPTDSDFIDIAGKNDSLLALADLGSARRLVEFDLDATLDGEVSYAAALTGSGGTADYRNETGVTLVKNGCFVAAGSINSSGKFVRSDDSTVIEPAAGYSVGWDFSTLFEPLPPNDAQMGAAITTIGEVRLRLVDTQHLLMQHRPAGDPDNPQTLSEINALEMAPTTPSPADIVPARSWTKVVSDFIDSGEDDMMEPGVLLVQNQAAKVTISAITWKVAMEDG